MIAVCPHCGAANDALDDAVEINCQKCSHRFPPVSIDEAASQRRAMWKVLAAILLLLTLLTLLLLLPARSNRLDAARQLVFGKPVAGRVGSGAGAGDSEGTARAGDRGGEIGSSVPDAQVTKREEGIDAPIGRAPRTLGNRKPGDEVRAGAAGTDDPANRIGNSRTALETNDSSSGANPGNTNRNNVETPDGNETITGRSGGEDAGSLNQTNSRSSALLLDDFSERLRQAGARSGDVQISLEWKNINDLDLHVIDPAGEEIFYNHRRSASGGLLDVDMNATKLTWRPVENVYWPEQGAARGIYRVEVVHFANHGAPDPTSFSVRVINKGQATYHRGFIKYVPNPIRSRVLVCQFEVR